MNEYGIVVDGVSVLGHNTYNEILDRTTNRTLDAIRNGIRRRGMDAGEVPEAKNHSRRLFADKTASFDAMFHSSHPIRTCSRRDAGRCNLNFNSKMKCTPSSRRYAKITEFEVRPEVGGSQSRRMRTLGLWVLNIFSLK